MQIKNNIKIHNRFDIEIVDKNTGEIKQSLVSYNIVLSQMYTRLCGGLAYFVNIHFGSGTGTLSPSRTTLFTHLGTKAAVDEEIIKAIPLSVWKRKIVLNPEEYVGNTISEVGIAFGSTNTNLVTHSLLKDSEGNTISIVKTDIDVITIYATVFVTFDTANPNLTYISMPSSNQLVNYLIGGSSAPTGAFGLLDLFKASSFLGTTSNVTWTSDTANKQRKTNVPRFATTVGNGHVKYLNFANLFRLKLPSIGIFNGQSYAGVSLGVGDGVRKKYDLPSANIRNNSEGVKVNGVSVSNYIKEIIYRGARAYIDLINTGGTFSDSIVVSGDGKTVVIGKRIGTYVGIYENVDGAWVERTINIPGTSWSYFVATNYDGSVVGIATSSATTIKIYDKVGNNYVFRADLSTGGAKSLAFSDDGNLLACALANSPYIETYNWNGASWVKRSNPDILPTGAGTGVSLNGNGSILAVSHTNSPYISVYDWNGTNWIKRSNPEVLPTGNGLSVSLSDDGSVLLIVHSASPYFTSYDWNGTNWIKRNNPVTLPTSTTVRGSMSGDGNSLIIVSGTNKVAQFYNYVNNEWLLINSYTVVDNTSHCSISDDGLISVISDSGNSSLNTCIIFESLPFTRITFDSPPAIGDVITADYIVDGVHKTDQYVIDASFAIQFGEI